VIFKSLARWAVVVCMLFAIVAAGWWHSLILVVLAVGLLCIRLAI
jgi:hypothetical protein